MISAAIDSLSLGNLPFGWFDFIFVALLVFGAFRGRKNGMTKELVPTLRWISIVVAAGLGYEFSGDIFRNYFGLNLAPSYCLGYLTVAFIVFLLFIPAESFLTPRLAGSNIFGGSEYYLGIASGVTRYLAVIFFFLALMNAPRYSNADIKAHKEYAAKTFGGGQQGFSGDFFPTFQEVQEGVFRNSLVGPLISDHLVVMLIDSAPVRGNRSQAKLH
jgi:hypothetical protein